MDENGIIRHSCTNCGKVIEVSMELLRKNSGRVVCQQCGENNLVISVPPTRTPRPKPAEEDPVMAIPPLPQDKTSAPPPHRQRTTKKSSSPLPPLPPSDPAPRQRTWNDPETKKKTATRKKSSKSKAKSKAENEGKSSLAPHSTLGCLWRSLLATAILLLLYIIIGYAMRMI